MASCTFVLKEPTSLEPTLVYLIFRFNGTKFKYSTGQKIKPKFWNPEIHKAREVRGFDYKEFNVTLKNLDSTVSNTYRKLINDKIAPTPDRLRPPLDEVLNKTKSQSNDLISFAEGLVDSSNRKEGTKRQLRQAIRNLKEFRIASKHSLHFDSIDLDFYDSYISFLLAKDYGTNTIGTMIKNLKVFMNEAVDRNLTSNLQYKSKRFKVLEEDSENIYLTVKEVKKLFEKDLAFNPRLEKVRDLFVIGCYTGLRFFDLSNLSKENFIDHGNMIKVKTEKTGETVIIPLHDYVKQIIKKNKGVPESYANAKMNLYLKELAELTGFDEDIMINSTRGGKKYSESFKKFELVSVHTARRTFATNAYLANVPTISIMKITGHKTEKSFLKYIKISQEDNANKLINHPFFK